MNKQLRKYFPKKASTLNNKKGLIPKALNLFNIMAGVVGIEPTLAVLETDVLPLYDTPNAYL